MLDKVGEDRTKSNRWAVFRVGSTPEPPVLHPASPAPIPHVAGKAGSAGSIPGDDVLPIDAEVQARRRASAFAVAKKKISDGQLFDPGPNLPD